MASLDRISACSRSNRTCRSCRRNRRPGRSAVLAFDHVAFSYVERQPVLRDATFSLERGKTYALVGPTGGGKTTTASLMARLYDPTARPRAARRPRHPHRSRRPSARSASASSCRSRSSSPARSATTSSTATTRCQTLSDEELVGAARGAGTSTACSRASSRAWPRRSPPSATASASGRSSSIAFMRAVLREPEILILDEATANIDTVTEQLLEQILARAAAVHDEGGHRAPAEHDRERRRDLLHQRRRDHAGRLDGRRAGPAAAPPSGELECFSILE